MCHSIKDHVMLALPVGTASIEICVILLMTMSCDIASRDCLLRDVWVCVASYYIGTVVRV